MAEGRLLNKRVCIDKGVHDLSNDTSRFLFVCAIAHLDRDGRVIGDPALLKAVVAPRRDEITTADMETFIRDWAENGLVLWYEAAGERWLEFPSFRKNQPNLRYDREPPSAIPPASSGHLIAGQQPDGEPPADCRQRAGEMPAEDRQDTGEPPASEVSKSGSKEEGTRAPAREDSLPAPECSPEETPGPDPPAVRLTLHFARRYMERTLHPWMPIETHYAQAAGLLRECPDAEEAVDPYFDEPQWFTWDRQRNKGTLSFGGFCAHAAEILAAHPAPRAGPPPRICPVCGCQVVGTMQSCGECGMEKSKFGDPEAVEEHGRWWQERLQTSKRSAQS